MTTEPEIALGVGARSEKGRREENQDKMTGFSTPLGTFYIVADGMGGHRGGAAASMKVVEGYRKHLSGFQEGADLGDILQHATTLTNAEILDAGRSGDPAIAGMGSTVVMAMLRATPVGMEATTAHIGDSRAYLLRNGELVQLTRDHSAVQRMVDDGLIPAEAARSHPDLNVLTRAIGKQADVAIEVGASNLLYPGDTLLLCTDGLWGHLSDEELIQHLGSGRSGSEIADALVDLAYANGSDDNITVQVLRLAGRGGTGRAVVAPQLKTRDVGRTTQPMGVPALAPALSSPAAPVPDDAEPVKRQTGKTLIYCLIFVLVAAAIAGGAVLGRRFWPAKQPAAAGAPPAGCTAPGSVVDRPCPKPNTAAGSKPSGAVATGVNPDGHNAEGTSNGKTQGAGQTHATTAPGHNNQVPTASPAGMPGHPVPARTPAASQPPPTSGPPAPMTTGPPGAPGAPPSTVHGPPSQD